MPIFLPSFSCHLNASSRKWFYSSCRKTWGIISSFSSCNKNEKVNAVFTKDAIYMYSTSPETSRGKWLTLHLCYGNLLDKTLKIPINFESDSLKQKSHNGKTNKQQNKTNKQRIILPFQTGKNRFVPNLLRAKKTQRSANYEPIKMYISRQMWLANSIFAPDHTPSLHIFASYLP